MLANQRRGTANDGPFQIRDLDGRQCSFESLVPHLQPGAIDGLFEGVTGENAESMRNARLLGGLSDAASALVDNHVVMRGIAAKKTSDADDGVVFLCFGEGASCGRNFECAGHADDVDVFALCATTQKAITCAKQESLSDKRVKTRDNNREAAAGGIEVSLKRTHERLGNMFNLQIGALVVRNSVPPAMSDRELQIARYARNDNRECGKTK